MKLRKSLTLSLSILLATQSFSTFAYAEERSEVSATEVPVAPGVSATVIKEVNSGKITTGKQLEYRLKNLTIAEREAFLNEAKVRLAEIQKELSSKVLEANSAGKAFITSKLSDISVMSQVVFLAAGLTSQFLMTSAYGASNTNYVATYQETTKSFAKILGVIALISAATAVTAQLGDLYLSQSIAVNTDDLQRLKQQVALEERNVDMLLNDLLVAKEITIALSGRTSSTRISSQVNVSSVLQLDEATKDLFKQTLITSSDGAETFIKTVKNLPIKSRIALLNDAIRSLEIKQSELSVALSSSGLSQKAAISKSLGDLAWMSTLGAIATGGTALAHIINGNAAIIKTSGVPAQVRMIRAVRILAGLTAFQAVAATSASWVNEYYFLASQEQVTIIKGQVERLTSQLTLIRDNLKQAEEISQSTAVVQKK